MLNLADGNQEVEAADAGSPKSFRKNTDLGGGWLSGSKFLLHEA